MKQSSLILLFFLLVLTRDLPGQDGLVRFAETWLRDDIVVKNKRIPRVTWSITIDDKTLVLVELSEQRETLRSIACNLDGSETHSIIRGSPTKESRCKLKLNKSKTKIVIQQRLIVSGMPNIPPQTYRIQHSWELAKWCGHFEGN